MDRLDFERDDRLQDERDESLRPINRMTMDEIREEYDLKIEFYGLKDSSIEFNERVEELAKYMRIDEASPDFEKITPEIKELSVLNLDDKLQKAEDNAKIFSEGITVQQYCDRFIDTSNIKMIDNDGKEYNLYDVIRKLNINEYSDRYTIKGETVSPNESINNYFKQDVKFEPLTREEVIDKCQNKNRSLEMVLFEKYSKTDEVKIERDYNERLIDSLKKIYDEKGLKDPDLKYCLEHYNDEYADKYIKSYVSAFAKSLSPEEKLCLIPRNADEMRNNIENNSFGRMDELYRPIYGYGLLNNEMVDRMAESLQGSRCVEFGCGNGMLSRMLQDRGVNVTPVDIGDEKTNSYYSLKNNTPATEITYMDAREYLSSTDEKIDYVILSWPPHGNSMSSDICEMLMEKSPDTKIVYIGESEGGCTANDRFFELTERSYDQEGIDMANYEHYSFPNIYDEIELRTLINI